MPARTSPTLHLPSPPTVHQLSRLALFLRIKRKVFGLLFGPHFQEFYYSVILYTSILYVCDTGACFDRIIITYVGGIIT